MTSQSSTCKILSTAIVFLSLCSLSLTGYSAPEKSVVVNGKTLKHLGRGLREFLFIDIYNLDAYSESGACAPGKIVYNTETKMLRLTMIRNIPVERLKSELSNTFKENMPKKGDLPALQKKIDTFLTYLKQDLTKGATMEINFVPGKGSTIKQNGKPLGPSIPGRDFAELAWRSYFGGNTCCKQVKRMVLDQCKKGGN